MPGAPSAKADCRCRVNGAGWSSGGSGPCDCSHTTGTCRLSSAYDLFTFGLEVRKVIIMTEVDLEILISLVQEHPVLWDKTLEEYKDRIKTRNAWIEIFKQLHEGFEEMEDNKRNEYGEYKKFI